ncbi:MAG: response regulator [Pirellulales bacterium]|nr:response regulator [Pirellulales bacterium]
MRGPSTVFVVDDNAGDRGVVGAVAQQIGLRCAEYDAGQALLDALEPFPMGCLVSEVRLPDMSGLDIQQHLVQWGATLPILFVTGHGDTSTAVRALQMGAFEFLEKPVNRRELRQAIEEAVALDLELRREWDVQQTLAEHVACLAPDELQLLEMLIDGKPDDAVARALQVDVRTVERRRTLLIRRLGVESVADLFVFAGAALGGRWRAWNDKTHHVV